MVTLSLGEAAEKARTSKVDIWRVIQEGGWSAQRTDDGGFAIDPAELFRVFEAQGPEQPAMEQDATTAIEALGQTETSVIPETAETNDIAAAFATLGAELKGILRLPVEERGNTDRISTTLKDKGPTSRNASLNLLPNWLLCERPPKRREQNVPRSRNGWRRLQRRGGRWWRRPMG